MHLLKQSFALLAICSVLFLTACQQQSDDCTPPALEQNIVGKWNATWENNATVEFKSDGTLIDASDAIFGIEVNGVQYSVKTYEIRNNSDLYVRAEAPNDPTQNADATFPIIKNECDVITVEFLGIGADLERQ